MEMRLILHRRTWLTIMLNQFYCGHRNSHDSILIDCQCRLWALLSAQQETAQHHDGRQDSLTVKLLSQRAIPMLHFQQLIHTPSSSALFREVCQAMRIFSDFFSVILKKIY